MNEENNEPRQSAMEMVSRSGARIVIRPDAYAGISKKEMQLRRQAAANAARRIMEEYAKNA